MRDFPAPSSSNRAHGFSINGIRYPSSQGMRPDLAGDLVGDGRDACEARGIAVEVMFEPDVMGGRG
jgi:hypothetical protein